jgi:2-polyprenyl-3-methyl-5-hydroxy-6-metoxy-1,4-benzoquinol methylase
MIDGSGAQLPGVHDADLGAARCAFCFSNEHRPYLEDCTDRLYGHAGTWNLVECRGCGLVYTVPISPPDGLLAYYPKDYGPHASAGELRATVVGMAMRALLTLPYRLRFGSPDWTPLPFGGGTMLDVGCGRGALLRRMAAAGWRCWGIDASPFAVAKARAHVPAARVVHARIEDIPRGSSFDLITAVHVIEHLPDPVSALRRINALLALGGKLFVSLPNLDSAEAKLFGRSWMGLEVPRHCVHFRERVFRSLLQQTGFAVLSARPALFPSSVSESLILMLPLRMRRRVVGSRAARYLYLLAAPFAVLSYVLGNRGVLEIVAEKRRQCG